MGMGHAMRCAVLAKAFESAGAQCVFLSSKKSLSLIAENPLIPYPCKSVSREVEGEDGEIRAIISLLMQYSSNILVLDGYHFGRSYLDSICQEAKKIGVCVVLMDDENNRGDLPVDFLINASILAFSMGYSLSCPKGRLLLGPEFTLLRDEFRRVENYSLEDRNSLLITMGGADPTNVTLGFLDALLKEDSLTMPVVVVTGKAFKNFEKVDSYANQYPHRVVHHHDCQRMSDLMQGARLAVSAAGSTVNELIAMRVPSLLCIVAQNQLLTAYAQAQRGWCKSYDCRDVLPVREIVAGVKSLWSDDSEITRMFNNTDGILETSGAERVVDEILCH
jgi:UDP-2,4-diacetamido-2,4,6-trideoxy-beta-L-altropyranose hydrolase